MGIFANQLREVGDEVLVFYSAEEPEISIYHRLLALLSVETGDPWSTSEVRDYLRDEHSRPLWPSPQDLVAAHGMLRSWERHCFVVHRPSWTVADIAAHARSLADRHKVGAIFVDYLQRIPPPPRSYDRRDIEVSAVGRHLKSLAVELSLPVLVAAQINRDAVPPNYGKLLAGKTYAEAKAIIRKARPDLHHLREGGSEQEADLVLGLLNYAADYRTEVNQYVNVPKVTLLEVGTLKQRYGASGKWAELALEGRAQLIRDFQYKGEA
jgi:replicative DNA helicase